MYPHKCHEPLAPCGLSGTHDFPPPLPPTPLSLSVSPYSFLPTHCRQIRTSDCVAMSVRQLTPRRTWTRCITVYLYLHSTEYLNTGSTCVCSSNTHTHTHTRARMLGDSSTHISAFLHHSRTRTIALQRWRTDGVMHSRALIVLADFSFHVKVFRHMGNGFCFKVTAR